MNIAAAIFKPVTLQRVGYAFIKKLGVFKNGRKNNMRLNIKAKKPHGYTE